MDRWTNATAALPWGVQRMVIEALEAVKDGQISMCFGADVRNGKPCLVNAIGATVVDTKAGKVNPGGAFPDLVKAFDHALVDLTGSMPELGNGFVSPLAAEVLLRHFGTLKDAPELITEEAIDNLTTAIFNSETGINADVANWIDESTEVPNGNG